MDIFFNGSSVAEKGTLCYLKNVFEHRSVKKDVGESFNHAAHFIKFVTYGYVVLACMELCKFKSLDDEIDLGAIPDKAAYLNSVTRKLVDMFWHDPDTKDVIHPPTEEEAYAYCSCREGIIPFVIQRS